MNNIQFIKLLAHFGHRCFTHFILSYDTHTILGLNLKYNPTMPIILNRNLCQIYTTKINNYMVSLVLCQLNWFELTDKVIFLWKFPQLSQKQEMIIFQLQEILGSNIQKKALIILIINLYSVSRGIYAICEWILHLFKDFFPKKDYKWNRENSEASEYWKKRL